MWTALATALGTAAAEAGGSAIAGGIANKLFGGGTSNKDRNRATAEDLQWQYQAARKMPLAQVQGAKAAGLHPLFAMGKTPISTAPQVIGGQSNTGSAVSDAFSRSLNRIQTLAAESEIEKNRSEALKNKADAMATMSRAAIIGRQRAAQVGNEPAPMENLYIPYRDNRTGKTVYLPNPKSGIEMPETLGAGYWLDAKALQSIENGQKARIKSSKTKMCQTRRGLRPCRN